MCNWSVEQMRRPTKAQTSPKRCFVLLCCIQMGFSGLAVYSISCSMQVLCQNISKTWNLGELNVCTSVNLIVWLGLTCVNHSQLRELGYILEN